MKSTLITLCTLLFSIMIFSQEGNPTDYLDSDFHKSRRDAFRAEMPDNSVAVLFANPVRNRANDVDYIYHQDPNFYYLSGYNEPNAVLVIFSNNQTNTEGENYNEVLYVQEKNEQQEQWNGTRLGIEGAKSKLGFEVAYNGSDFSHSGIDFSTFNKVMFVNFEDDYRDSKRDEADLFSLVESFKTQANYSADAIPDPMKERVYQMIKATEIENSANVAQNLGRALDRILSRFKE